MPCAAAGGGEWVNHEAVAWLAPAAVYQLGERLRRGASTSSLLPGPQPAGLLGKQEGQAQLIKLWAQTLQDSRGRREHGKPMWDPLQDTSLFWGALSSSTFLPLPLSIPSGLPSGVPRRPEGVKAMGWLS